MHSPEGSASMGKKPFDDFFSPQRAAHAGNVLESAPDPADGNAKSLFHAGPVEHESDDVEGVETAAPSDEHPTRTIKNQRVRI